NYAKHPVLIGTGSSTETVPRHNATHALATLCSSVDCKLVGARRRTCMKRRTFISKASLELPVAAWFFRKDGPLGSEHQVLHLPDQLREQSMTEAEERSKRIDAKLKLLGNLLDKMDA